MEEARLSDNADAPGRAGMPDHGTDGRRRAVPSHLSLEGMHNSVAVPHPKAGFWQQWRAYTGPALLVSVGYMDPGNWGTDLQGGAQFKYGLLWVVLVSSVMAIFLQTCSARLGIGMGKDLAQACRDHYPRWTLYPNWIFCEVAIGACDLAEVLGSAVALNLLFHIPIFWAVLITACDVFILLALQRFGMRTIEAVVLVLVGTIGVAYVLELFVLPRTIPNFMEMASALVHPGFRQVGMATVAIGIVGATVMPHNLYLHSALVQSRRVLQGDDSKRAAIRFNTIDVTAALGIAFFVNAAILVLAAMVFYGKNQVTVGGATYPFNDDTDWIRVAFLTLAPLLGTAAASTLFAVALLASGQSSTITGTLAGQVVMEGFTRLTLKPWVRRLVTRLLAILPAVFLIGVRGDGSVNNLLVLSQVVLALQLPFAMFPLMHFTSRTKFMGKWKNGWILFVAGWTSAVLITAMDVYGLPDALHDAWKVIHGGS
jgi:manganese transport protein